MNTPPVLTHQNLRVLHVVRPAAGGIRSHVSALCTELARRGMAIGIASPRPIVTAHASCEQHTVPISARPGPSDMRAWRQLERIARGHDLVHAHGLRGAWIAGPAARRAGVPFLFTAHNLAPSPSLLVRSLFAAALRGCSGVIAVSGAVAQSLTGYGVPSAHVIPGGIDIDALVAASDAGRARRTLGLGSDAPLVVGVGRLAPEKGFAALVAAAPRIAAEAGASIVIAGDGPLREELRRAAGEHVRLIGHTDRPGDLLAAADVVVVPSLQEGLGLVPIEAMALGRPVVASRVGGLVEVVDDGITGALVEPGNPEALAQAVIDLLGAPDLRRRMGEAGRERVLASFTLARMVDATVAVYEAVVSGAQRRSAASTDESPETAPSP